ncbi:MAG TPA: HAMP domain-containing sensor histidine kinase [Streptosporangiaceae bacterium]|nr:HAMP domain-containing sensor histidine kinase [Streptosporangiaceae bacterium]
MNWQPAGKRHSVRLRLTAIYVGLFVLSAAGLLTITDLLVVNHEAKPVMLGRQKAVGGSPGPIAIGGPVSGGPVSGSNIAGGPACLATGSGTALNPQKVGPQQLSECATYFQAQIAAQRVGYINTTLIGSGIALAAMTAVAVGLGWVMSGRVLRPLRTITWAARNISASNLHRRLALPGPRDELKELADTVDGLLARLEASFDAQRQFVANASHELRTPLARQRTLVEVALAEPEPTVTGLRSACERVLAAGDQQERLIEALLTLARSQRGLDRWERIDLVTIAAEVLRGREGEAAAANVQVNCTIGGGAMAPAGPTAVLLGDVRLTERLVANLVDNAVRHNVPGGWICLRVGTEQGQAVLTAANSGPIVPPGEVARLFAPFQRLGGGRGATARRRDGQGLGLSIVSAIAAAHGADLKARARLDGGLHIELRFPPLPALPDHDHEDLWAAVEKSS